MLAPSRNGLRAAVAVVCFAFVETAACGGQGWTDPGPVADVDPAHVVAGSTFDDRVRLCDWLAGRLGGYDRQRTCGLITLTSTPNQSQCTAGLASTPAACTLTYGELVACVNALINGPCAADTFPDACDAVGACPGFGQ
jgi:hypothetical protein